MKQVNHLSEENQSAKGEMRQGLSERFSTKSVYQTRKLGKEIARKVSRVKPKMKAVILALRGELGSGKTTFVQGFARGLGIKEKIFSPTFILIRRHTLQDMRYKNFYHIDCYRLKKPKELLGLDFKDIISNPQNIVAVEWAEKVKRTMPRGSIKIKFKFIGKNTRQIEIVIPRGI